LNYSLQVLQEGVAIEWTINGILIPCRISMETLIFILLLQEHVHRSEQLDPAGTWSPIWSWSLYRILISQVNMLLQHIMEWEIGPYGLQLDPEHLRSILETLTLTWDVTFAICMCVCVCVCACVSKFVLTVA